MRSLRQIFSRCLTGSSPARGGLFPWVPVLIGLGIGLWFSLRQEPDRLAYGLVVAVALMGLGMRRLPLLRLMGVVLICLAMGFLAAGLRSQLLDLPVLGFRYYGPVEGRVIAIDRSQSDKIRLTLDQVVLANTQPDRTPAKVRISLHGDQRWHQPAPGEVVILTAHLAPPEGPVEPGGFDFQRMAWFDRLGAVGYTRTPVLLLEEPEPGAQPMTRLRARIRAAVEARITGPPGAFAAAVLTGDRAGISQEVQEDLRRSNLAHLLAISGLHMGLLVGFVFATLRMAMALVPSLALRWPTKKIAAAVALAAGAFYLALSGGSVATERAFTMVAVMLGAVIFDRRAISLRSVALAAMVLLLLQPETLLEPGFQMSFAATVALIAGFAELSERGQGRRLPWWLRPVFALVFTSLLAGLATAPVAAAHFNRVSNYGLIANLLAVPVMGLAVMPAGVVAGILAPFGLAGPALKVMELGTSWILSVAHWVSGMEGVVRGVPAPSATVLPLLALGMLWLLLWRGPLRWAGLPPALAAFFLWSMAPRPEVLISADAALIGVMGPEGRRLSHERGAGFAARQWLENDGEETDQAAAAARAGFFGPRHERRITHAGWHIAHLKGRGATERLAAVCESADLVVIAADLKVEERPDGCVLLSRDQLRGFGAVSIAPQADGALLMRPAQDHHRRWYPGEGASPQLLYKAKTGQSAPQQHAHGM